MKIHQITYQVPLAVQDPHEVAAGVTETVTVTIMAETPVIAKRRARDWILRDLDLDQRTTELVQTRMVYLDAEGFPTDNECE